MSPNISLYQFSLFITKWCAVQVVWGALNYFLHDCGVLGAYQLYVAVVRRAATDTNGGLSPGCNEEVFVEGQSGQQTSSSRPATARHAGHVWLWQFSPILRVAYSNSNFCLLSHPARVGACKFVQKLFFVDFLDETNETNCLLVKVSRTNVPFSGGETLFKCPLTTYNSVLVGPLYRMKTLYFITLSNTACMSG